MWSMLSRQIMHDEIVHVDEVRVSHDTVVVITVCDVVAAVSVFVPFTAGRCRERHKQQWKSDEAVLRRRERQGVLYALAVGAQLHEECCCWE